MRISDWSSDVCSSDLLCLIPGLPKFPFLLAGGLMLVLSSRIPKDEEQSESTPASLEAAATAHPDTPEQLVAEIQVDPLGLELSADMIDLVDTSTGCDLLDRATRRRRKGQRDARRATPPVLTRDHTHT